MTEQNKFFTIEKQISAELISDMLITAVESGISYWCKYMRAKFENKSNLPYYANCFDQNWKVEICAYEEEPIALDISSVKKGVEIMSNNYPRHYSDMMNDNADAVTADVFFQCIAFGKVIYG
jgi:hypothetical protein